jgi:hypothetical protein
VIISLNEGVNKENSARFLLLAAFIFHLVGCKSAQEVPLPEEAGRQFDTKAQIKSNNDTNTVKIQIALLPNKAMRMEVTATLGVSIATVLVTPANIRIALHNSREFITGPLNEKTLYPVFRQNVSPRVLWKIVHDQNPAWANLKCELNQLGKPVSCTGVDGTTVSYTYETAIQRRILIKNNKFEMDWIFKDQMQLPAYQNETFVLKKPEFYKEIVIK